MRPRPVFVFSGQGSQWAGMGRELLERSTVFEMVLRACDAQVRRHLGWSLLDVVTAREAPLGDIEVSCPTIVAMELALRDQYVIGLESRWCAAKWADTDV